MGEGTNKLARSAGVPTGPGGARLVLGLSAVTLWLVLAAIVGAVAIGGSDGAPLTSVSGVGGSDPSAAESGDGGSGATGAEPGSGTATSVDPATGQSVGSPDGGGTGQPQAQAGTTQPGGSSGGDATGVTANQIRIGVHAPVTFSGVPLNLAEDPIKGIRAYVKFLNENQGGINGRALVVDIVDDRFDADGANSAARQLIDQRTYFMVSGTLGIDQVAIVGSRAAQRGVPYTAAGGAEERPIPAMYQLGTSYTTHVEQLARFIASNPNLQGKRIGILVSDSEYIRPVADTFRAALRSLGQTVSTVVENQKPAQNPDYNNYILQFQQARTEVLVPLTDPLTTQQIVQRCAAGAVCGWTYSFSDFAHESDTALALMAPTWSSQRVQGLAGGCYYVAPEVEGTNCASMRTARDQYVAINGQDDWEENGSGAASGYQLVSFLKGALRTPGTDLTRERFRDALAAYSGYSDLISSPITFLGSRNTMHGSERMTVFEAQPNLRYKMITPGFVDGF